jgi:hypothetical protein
MKATQSETDSANRARLMMLEEVIAGHILVPPKFARYPEIEEVLWHTVQRVMVGELAVEDGLHSMTEQIREIISSS